MIYLTDKQLEAINSTSGFLAITAGAGSGKTHVIVERLNKLLNDKIASFDEILAITFTEKAAAELKERITKATLDVLGVASAQIGTFHSFCTKILKEHAPLIGIDPDFNVIDAHTSGILIRKAAKEAVLKSHPLIEEFGFKDAVACVEDLLNYRWHARKIQENRKDPVRNALLSCFDEAVKIYSLSKSGNLDFQDLEIFAISLLEIKDILFHYHKRFKHIFVDEFQDINDTQARIISLLHDPSANTLTIVGDQKQSIYRFRGANVHEFEKAVKQAKNTVILAENHRSRPEIIEFINKVFQDFEPLIATREQAADSVCMLAVVAEEDAIQDERRVLEAKMVSETISLLKGSTACLFNSLNSSLIYARALAEKGIPHIIYGGGGFLDNQKIIDIINAMRVSNNHSDLVALLGLARSPYIGMTDEELLSIAPISHEKIKDHPKGAFLKTLNENAPYLSISELIHFIAGDNMSDSIDKLHNMAATAEDREKVTLSDFIDYLTELKNRDANIPNFPVISNAAVALLTVHQAKGLEFDNVILCDTIRNKNYSSRRWCFIRGGKNDIAFKIVPEDNPEGEPEATEHYAELSEIDKSEDELERLRLLYVAMTRAREKLIIPIHPGAKKDGRWHKLLIDACHSSMIPAFTGRNPVTLDSRFHGNDTSASTSINLSTCQLVNLSTFFTVSELETYERSPEEYFKRYILKTPDIQPAAIKKERLPASIIGDIVHRMIEYHSRELDVASLLDNVRMELQTDIGALDKEEIIAQFEHFLASRFDKAKGSKNEVPFLMGIGGHFIKGKLDMLIKNNSDCLEIVDFKTGHKKDAHEFDLQVKTYALAVAKASKSSSIRVTLAFLSKNGCEEMPVVITNNDLQSVEQRLLDIIMRINAYAKDHTQGNACRSR